MKVELICLDCGTSEGGGGLDNLGRVDETHWVRGSNVIEKITYGYNRASNRQWRRNQLAHANGGDEATRHDNFYWYDGLYQVVQRQLGNLTGTAPAYTGIDYRQQNEDWCYDSIGNWNHYANEVDSNLSQFRSHNAANEIISVTNPSEVVQPAYDKVGNQTSDIAPGGWDTQFDLKWDAWNRLVEVRDGTTLVQANAYDGLTRRITSTDGTNTVHYYYNTAWRAVEHYLNAAPSPERRHLWGLRSRWDLVKRERDTDISGSLDEKRYVLFDAMDPVAICNEAGAIAQRFEYSPFGQVSFMNADFTSDSTPEPWDFLFHGEFRDAATGYYNYGYRYYNPLTGRWPSRDPLEENWETDEFNQYGFVRNNGLSYFDFLGMRIGQPARREREPGDSSALVIIGGRQVPRPPPQKILVPKRLPYIYSVDPMCDSLKDAIALANAAIRKGKCKKWFDEHSSWDFLFAVTCHGKCHPYCLLPQPMRTFPPFGDIHVCIDKAIDNWGKHGLASLLIHEVSHHYVAWVPFYEGGAIEGQGACEDAILGKE